MNRPRTPTLLMVAVAAAIVACAATSSPEPTMPTSAVNAVTATSPQGDNAATLPQGGLLKSLGLAYRFFFDKPSNTQPAAPVPVRPLTREQLLAAPDNTVYRLGHSTVLLKLNGAFFLTDPVFSERASPVQWAGPKRFHAPPITIEDLPPIQAVVLSHDHYDHLDHASILKLADKVDHFITPLGVGDRLVDWGLDAAKVRQLAWWDSTDVAGVTLVATPAQHFSGRTLNDGNRTLWASWALLGRDVRVFFSGDSGYFGGFKQIGERLGPFDLTLMETGAYDVNWPLVHMQPEESLQAHLDVQGRWLLPIHNGTFDLAMHAWYEPFDRIVALAATRGVAITTPAMGEPVRVQQAHVAEAWWRGVPTTEPLASTRPPLVAASVASMANRR